MRNNHRKALVAAVALLVVSANAHADWINGQGVVFFPSTNKERIIYTTNVSPYKGEASLATDKADYDKWNATVASKAVGSPVPAGYFPGTHYQADAMTPSAIIFPEGKWVYKHIGRNTTLPLRCAKGATCGEATGTVGADQCNSREIAYSFSAASSWKPKIKWAQLVANLVSGGSVGGSISTCTSKATSHTCYVDNAAIPYPTDMYVTIEGAHRFGYGKLTPLNGTIYEGTNGTTVKNLCAAAGGTYRWDTILGESFCTGVKDKVYRHQYQLWPIPNRSEAVTCRVIRVG